MIKEWIEGKEFKRLAEISDSTLKRFKRKIKTNEPDMIKLEKGKNMYHKTLLGEFSCGYYTNFHDLVNYQLNLGKNINSMNSIWALFILSKQWDLYGTLNYPSETSAKTCISRFKRIFESLKDKYPQIESFYATEKNGNRKGYHIHFLIKTSSKNSKTIQNELITTKFPSDRTLELGVYEPYKFGAGYITKLITENPDGYGLI